LPTLRLIADVHSLEEIRSFVTRVCRAAGLNKDDVWAIELATDEACSNVLVHAYKGKPGLLQVEVREDPEGICIAVRDWGEPFDPDAVPEPDLSLPLQERRVGGLGMYIMRKLMDEVTYHFDAEEGNTLILRRKAKPAQPEI
jgi:anti-sigma regulatory factor (Ser/Thr protein kinase)